MRSVEKTKVRVQPVLKLYLDLSGTNHLHFGLWEPNDPLDKAHFQKAQDRYLEKLIELIPKGVATILDVGCGVGGTACYLKDKGYQVTSMSPDPYQAQLFAENTKGEIPFHLTPFEKFESDEKYDLILFSESAQYMEAADIFKGASKFCKEGGYVLISDYFKKVGSEKIPNIPSYPINFIPEQAKKNSFSLIENIDITEATTPTLDYGSDVYFSYIKPILSCIVLTMKVHLKPLYYLFRGFLKIPVKGKSIRQTIINNLVPMEREVYLKHMEYRRFLFTKNK